MVIKSLVDFIINSTSKCRLPINILHLSSSSEDVSLNLVSFFCNVIILTTSKNEENETIFSNLVLVWVFYTVG